MPPREVARGVGDEHVDVAEGRVGMLEYRVGGLRIAHVGRFAGGLGPQRL